MSSVPSATNHKPSMAWNIFFWILQIFLGLAFGFGGYTKLIFPIETLTYQMVWPGDIPAALVRFIGASELLGGIGMILPAVTRIRPALTALAASGLALIMILAMIFHFTRGEYAAIGVNAAFAAMALVVAWGRFKKAPITPWQ